MLTTNQAKQILGFSVTKNQPHSSGSIIVSAVSMIVGGYSSASATERLREIVADELTRYQNKQPLHRIRRDWVTEHHLGGENKTLSMEFKEGMYSQGCVTIGADTFHDERDFHELVTTAALVAEYLIWGQTNVAKDLLRAILGYAFTTECSLCNVVEVFSLIAPEVSCCSGTQESLIGIVLYNSHITPSSFTKLVGYVFGEYFNVYTCPATAVVVECIKRKIRDRKKLFNYAMSSLYKINPKLLKVVLDSFRGEDCEESIRCDISLDIVSMLSDRYMKRACKFIAAKAAAKRFATAENPRGAFKVARKLAKRVPITGNMVEGCTIQAYRKLERLKKHVATMTEDEIVEDVHFVLIDFLAN